MNKQIQDLIKKATEIRYTGLGEIAEFDKEKFAELMVVEFVETVKHTATQLAQTGFNDGLSEEEVNKRVNGALAVLDGIVAKFGG